MLVIAPEPIDGPIGRALTDAYHHEASARFPADFDPARGLPATRRDLTPPNGIFLVAHEDDSAVGCGGLKTLDSTTGEIKHMFVQPSHRGRGIGGQVLSALEEHASTQGFGKLVLDTSEYLVEAIALYRRRGYVEIDPYNSNHYATHWFAKELSANQ